MERGLTRPVATLNLEPADISSRLGVRFESVRDDLDDLEAAVICGESGRQFALVRHRHQPEAGTDILTNERSRNLAADLREILRVLQFGIHELRWIHSAIRAKDLESAAERFGSERLKKAVEVAERIERLQSELASILGHQPKGSPAAFAEAAIAAGGKMTRERRTVSPESRRNKRQILRLPAAPPVAV
jgi:hypothetical protein